MTDSSFVIDMDRVQGLVARLSNLHLPEPGESHSHVQPYSLATPELANAYLLIVAICHQTSPVGQQRLMGDVRGNRLVGWDFLKEKWLESAAAQTELLDPDYWSGLDTDVLKQIYTDPEEGLLMTDLKGRATIIRDLGRLLKDTGCRYIDQLFESKKSKLFGSLGLESELRTTLAYRDPVKKKLMFFYSISIEECKWQADDAHLLESPVDYHEVRGHLRIGTVKPTRDEVRKRLVAAEALDYEQDIALRKAVQSVNRSLAESLGVSDDRIHYLLWNLFRNCCPRDSYATHCSSCPSNCALPNRFRLVPEKECLFSMQCSSRGAAMKVGDPPYFGDFY